MWHRRSISRYYIWSGKVNFIYLFRASLRDFVVELKEAEQQRDLARSEAADLGKQLADCEEQRDRANNRLNALNKSLCQLEEGKRGCDGRLASAQTALMLQVIFIWNKLIHL